MKTWMAEPGPAMTNGVCCAAEIEMSKRAFDKIMAGVKEARAYLNGAADKARYRVHASRRRTRARLHARQARHARRLQAQGSLAAPRLRRTSPIG
jgi:hypothetical protein